MLNRYRLLLFAILLLPISARAIERLPFSVVFKGQEKFDRLVQRATSENWPAFPIGARVAAVGQALEGTPYRAHTLEIDDRIEAPSVDLDGLDCWTFFEAALAFARMLDEPRDQWTPQTMLHYIELDRYRDGHCTGAYLSRLHYLEDWVVDNQRRGLVRDISRELGGQKLRGDAREMTIGWRGYRYLRANPALLPDLARMERYVTNLTVFHVPKNRVAVIESKLRDGDIISITSHEPGGRTSHVGLAVHDAAGTVHFLHASSPHNYGRVTFDRRLSDYLYEFGSHAGIIVARPLK